MPCPPTQVASDTKGFAVRRPYLLLGAIGLATAVLVSPGEPGGDTLARLQVSRSLWTREPEVSEAAYGIMGRGRLHAHYGIGQSLVMLPADVLAKELGGSTRLPPSIAEKLRVTVVTLLTFPLISAAILPTAAWLLLLLGFSRRQSFVGAIGLQFCTTLLNYTQVNQENSLLLLTTLLGYAGHADWLSSGKVRSLVLGSLALGFALLVRLTAAADIAAVFVFVTSCVAFNDGLPAGKRWRRICRYVAATCPVYLCFLLLDRYYHFVRFGSLWGTYIHIFGEQERARDPTLPSSFPFSTPMLDGLLGAFVAPNRSILLFDPLLVVTFGLLIRFRNQLERRLLIFAASASVLLSSLALLYARYYDWGGGAAWGNRFLTVPAELLSVLALPMLMRIGLANAPFVRGAGRAAVALSAFIQLESVVFWYNLEEAQALYWRRSVLVIGQRLFNIVAVMCGRFHDWGLAYPGYGPRYTVLNTMPFVAAKHVSPGMALSIQIAWTVALAAFVLFMWRLVSRSIHVEVQS